MTNQNDRQTTIGILCGLGAALIWGAWPVVTSIGIQGDITPVQIVMLRFFIAGLILAPFAFRGPSTARDWGKTLVLTLCAGAPYSILVSSAFYFAPASHGGVVIPGTVLFISVLAAHFWLGDRLTRTRTTGAGLIILGLIGLSLGAAGGIATLGGDLMFMAGGILWASYTFLLRRWPADGLMVASRVAFLSLLMFGIMGLFGLGAGLTDVPVKTLVFQGLWQGVLSGIVAILLFNKAVGILGSSRASIVNAMTPAIAVLLSFLILGETPTMIEFIGLLTIMVGIAVALGLRPKLKRAPKTYATL